MTKFDRLFVSLVAVAVLATACGASSDSSQPTSATGPVDGSSEETIASPDGLLTVGVPADGTEITIGLIQSGPGGALVIPVGTYELGPGGATFDPPLRAHITLSEQAMDQGVVILHETDDGAVESVPFEFDADGASFEIAGFSEWMVYSLGPYELRLTGPSQGFVGEIVNVELSLSVIRAGPEDLLDPNAVILSNRSEFILQEPLSRQGVDIVCSDEGFGLVNYDGKVTIDGRIGTSSYTWSTRSDQVVVLSHGVDCLRRTPIEPYDTRCQDRTSGDDAQGCPEIAEVGLSVSDSGMVDLSVDVSDEVSAFWSFTLEAGKGEFVIQEISEDGEFRSFYGAGAAEFFPEDSPTTVERIGGTVWLRNLPATLSGEPLQFSSPSGTTAGGQVVPAARSRLIDLTLFTSEDTPDGEVQGTYTFLPEHVMAALASMLLDISGVGDQNP